MTDIPTDLDDGSIPLRDLPDDEAVQVIQDALGLPLYLAHAYLAMAHGDSHPGLDEVEDDPVPDLPEA